MKTIRTNDGLDLSELSLGCMNLPVHDPFETERIIAYALAQGITYFDTADLYQFGDNEKVVGNILKKYRSQFNFHVGSKAGNEFDAKLGEKIRWNPSKRYIKRAIKDSLVRLDTDIIDLYQLHGGTIDDDKEDTITAFEELKKEGVIRSYGLSSIRMNVIDYYQKHSGISTLMMQFNPLDNRPLEVTRNLDETTLFARGPLMQGLFSNQASEVLSTKFKDGALSLTREELEQLISQFSEFDDDLAGLSYSFLSYHNAVIVNGVSSLEQLRSNLDSYRNKTELDRASYDRLADSMKFLKYGEHRL